MRLNILHEAQADCRYSKCVRSPWHFFALLSPTIAYENCCQYALKSEDSKNSKL